MKFQEIKENAKVFPGEYLLHQPSQQIVMCGAYKKSEGLIKALKNGQLMEDKVENFRKLVREGPERKVRPKRSCGGCKG
ncbi:MAG TPA: hypothetical protein EYN27_12820 [Rhodospirillales bacterium]|nr:hypothetical protein [Rhodospirillales bacterium]